MRSTIFCFILLLLPGCAGVYSRAPEGAESFDGRSANSGPAANESGRARLDLQRMAANPLPPERAAETLSELGENWMYGHGMGETLVAVGLIAAFPPFAIYALGNAALDLSGYSPLYVTDLLPARQRYAWREGFDGFVAGPGKLAAAIGGEEFRGRRDVAVRTGRIVDEVSGGANAK